MLKFGSILGTNREMKAIKRILVISVEWKLFTEEEQPILKLTYEIDIVRHTMNFIPMMFLLKVVQVLVNKVC